MPQRRFQQNPALFIQDGRWKFRYYKDVLVNGKIERIQPKATVGLAPPRPGALSKREAERKKAEMLVKLDSQSMRPTSLISFGDYFAGPYQTHFLATSKNHQIQMESMMRTHVLPYIGGVSLQDLSRTHVQALINQKVVENYSPQTVRHIRKHVSAVYLHAKSEHLVEGDNPAEKVKLPAKKRSNATPALTFEQATFVIRELELLYAAMATLSFCVSTNVAEMCGLKWKRVNVSNKLQSVDGIHLPPASVWIVEDFTQNEYRATKTAHRERILPIPAALAAFLKRWHTETKFPAPDAPVFAAHTGRPIYYNNTNKRAFKRLSYAIDVDFTWNSFRHSFSSFADELGVAPFAKKTIMGHSKEADITDKYGHATLDRLREIVEAISSRIGADEALNQREQTAARKVIVIR